MDPIKPGNEKMPDFRELDDRLIAQHSSEPFLVIKTNLDPENSTLENPYYKNEKLTDRIAFESYFDEDQQ